MRIFNLKPSRTDYASSVYRQSHIDTPDELDLRKWDSPVEDQGDLGSCVAHSVTSAYELMLKESSPEEFVELSRLFLYYNARLLEEITEYDAGVAHIRNAIKAMRLFGLCKESLWTYDKRYNIQPSDDCYIEALPRRIPSYRILLNLPSIIESLSMGFPVVIGLEVFPGFSSLTKENSLLVDSPSPIASLGGHSLLIVGYSLPERYLLAKNSFGTKWGDGGYCKISFDYARKHMFESWNFEIPQKLYTN